MGAGAAPPAPGHSWSLVAPAPLEPTPAPHGPQTSLDAPPPAPARPTCARAGSEPEAPGEVCARPRGRGGNFPSQRRPVPAAIPDPAGPARALGAATGTPAGENEARRWERPPARSAVTHSAAGPEASAADRARPPDADSHPPKLAAGPPRVRHGALGLGGAATSDPGSRGEGTRQRGDWSPRGHPRCPPPTAAPSRALTSRARTRLLSPLRSAGTSWVERWPVRPVVAPERQGRAGSGVDAGSGGAGVWPNEGRLAPSPPPSPAGCCRGAQRRPGLPGSPQRCDGVSAAQGAGRGAVSTHPSGQGSGP